jgi:regulator of nucleoside diphosphate kinase
MRQRNIILSSADRDQLLRLIDSARLDSRVASENLDALEGELGRATVVPPGEVPADVVTMNSTVWFKDLDSDDIESYTIVVPNKANLAQGRISIFAPLATAMLGYRLHDVVEWKVPAGKVRLEITKVVPQDEPDLVLA